MCGLCAFLTSLGIAAGYTTDTSLGMSGYFGMAKGAKIAFFDIGDSSGYLKIPSNLGTKMFPPG